MTKQEALDLAKALKDSLEKNGYLIHDVILFGSAAKDQMHEWSDIDIAVVCDPFLATKHEENVQFLHMSQNIDVRIETVCLHPKDFENKYFTLAKEVERYGIKV